jgi:hypothetical protein
MAKSLPPVSQKLVADAEQFISEFRRAERAQSGSMSRMGVELDKFQNNLKKKFSLGDIGKNLMQGLGIGSAMQIAEKSAELIASYWKEAAESSERIASASERSTKAVLEMIRRRETPNMTLARLQREEAGAKLAFDTANRPRYKRAHALDKGPIERDFTSEEAAKAAEARAAWAEARNALDAYQTKFEENSRKADANEWAARAVAQRKELNEQILSGNKLFLESQEKEKKATQANIDLEWDLAAARRAALKEQIEQGNKFFLEDQEEKKKKQLKEQKDLLEENAKRAEELADIFSDGFTQAIMEGRDFNDVLDGIGKSLLNMVLQQAIIKPLGNWLAAGVSSIFGGFFADGGTLGAGKWGIAGEAGPEIIKGPAEVVPMGKMGGGGNTYIIDARGTDESVVARLGQALKALAGPGVVERRALAAYSDNMRRGGAFA